MFTFVLGLVLNLVLKLVLVLGYFLSGTPTVNVFFNARLTRTIFCFFFFPPKKESPSPKKKQNF